MNNLTSQDLFFVKSKIQQSLQLSSSPTNKSKKPLYTSKSIHISSATLSSKETLKNSKKTATRQDLNDWMIRKQHQVKQFLAKQRMKEQEFNDEVKSSEEIKFRSKEDWLKLRSIKKNSKNFQIKKTQSFEVLPQLSKQKNCCENHNSDFFIDETLNLNGIKKSLDLREKSFSNRPNTSHSFEELNISRLRSTNRKVSFDEPQKYQYGKKKTYHQFKEYSLTPKKQVGTSLLTPKFNHFLNSKIKKGTEQNVKSDDKHLKVALVKTVDPKFKNGKISKFFFPTNSQTIQRLKNYSYRQMNPEEQSELKNRFRKLGNRLEQLLRSARKQKVFK